MMPHFIFCSGWGFNKRFWDPLLRYFKPGSYTVLESAYEKIDEEKNSCILTDLNLIQMTDTAFIGVGHSLGFRKLLNLPISYNQLVGLQAFTCFSGFDSSLAQRRKRILKTMSENLVRQPEAVLSQFYKKCGVDIFPEIQLSQPDQVALGQDLKLLQDSQEAPSDTPVIILGTSHDKIVPPGVIYDNFAKLKNVNIEILDLHGHYLGYRHEVIIFEKIANFVDVSFQR